MWTIVRGNMLGIYDRRKLNETYDIHDPGCIPQCQVLNQTCQPGNFSNIHVRSVSHEDRRRKVGVVFAVAFPQVRRSAAL